MSDGQPPCLRLSESGGRLATTENAPDQEGAYEMTDKGGNLLDEVIKVALEFETTHLSVFEQEEGGTMLYWPNSPDKLSIEISEDGEIYAHSADLEGKSTRNLYGELSLDDDTKDWTGVLSAWLENERLV